MGKKYSYIRIWEESKKQLDERLKKINQQDLKKMGIKKAKVPQIALTNFLFKERIFISNQELKKMAKKSHSKLC